MFCSHCGNNLEEGTQICPHCQTTIAETPPRISPVQDKASGMAITAMVCGIASLCCCCVPSAISIILGAIELHSIKKGYSSRKGYGFALTGLILGLIKLGMGLILWLIYLIAFIGFGAFSQHHTTFL